MDALFAALEGMVPDGDEDDNGDMIEVGETVVLHSCLEAHLNGNVGVVEMKNETHIMVYIPKTKTTVSVLPANVKCAPLFVSMKVLAEAPHDPYLYALIHIRESTTEQRQLRFKVGDRVLCKYTGTGEWLPGTVIMLRYREPKWPVNRVAAYQIKLDNGEFIYSPGDNDNTIRAAQAETTAATKNTNFAVGSIIVLRGLVSAVDLNDKVGIIKSGPIKTPGPHLNRFIVNLFDTNKSIAVKLENMICRGEEFLDPSTDYTVLEDLGEMGQPFLMPPDFRNLTCTCCASNDNDGSVIVECEHVGKPKSLFRPMGGHLSFLGSLQMPNGTYMKMNDPRDYLVPESESYPGHTMTIIEIFSEFSHCDDYEGSFHQDYSTRNISPSLVDFRDMTTGDSVSDDITMYPFHAELVPPYTESMAPKFRADDVVTIITNKEFKLSEKLSIEPGELINVYVISFTSSGVVTGIIKTNISNYWVYFPHYCVRQLLKRGSYWKPK